MIQNIVETFSHFSEISLITVGIFIGAFVLLKLRTRFFKSIPAVLPVTILGVIFGIIGKQL
jgi:prepilin signal peptidase PulO-like enzyme (type II secretory pathway)